MRGSTAGISDGLKRTSKNYFRFITFLDVIISTFVITPLVVSYWRGTWGLMDNLVYPGDVPRSALVSCLIGYIGTAALTIGQNSFSNVLNPNTHRITYYAFSRLYTAVFSFICVNHWRGCWTLLDHYTGIDPTTIATITGVSVVLLGLTKTIRNLSAPPFTIAVDRLEGYFEVPRAFRNSTKNFVWYLLDCAFSVCVVGTLVVFVWRGHWTLLEVFLYPGQMGKSALASLVIGYSLVIITFLLQPVMKYLARTLDGIYRLFVVDVYLLVSFSATINVWRGLWNLLNLYFLPHMPLLSFFITHSLCFLLLVLINASNSILVRGVYIDGQEDGEQCVDFPCYYIRLFFQERRRKKLLRGSGQRKISLKSPEADGLIQEALTPEIVSNHSITPTTPNSV